MNRLPPDRNPRVSTVPRKASLPLHNASSVVRGAKPYLPLLSGVSLQPASYRACAEVVPQNWSELVATDQGGGD